MRIIAANTLRERLNVLKAGRTGLFQAFDIRRDKPDIWNRPTTSGSVSLTITADDLPYFTSGHAAAISTSRFIARIDGAPANYTLTVGGNPLMLQATPEPELVGLLASNVNGLALGIQQPLAAPVPTKLRELIVIVNYSHTS